MNNLEQRIDKYIRKNTFKNKLIISVFIILLLSAILFLISKTFWVSFKTQPVETTLLFVVIFAPIVKTFITEYAYSWEDFKIRYSIIEPKVFNCVLKKYENRMYFFDGDKEITLSPYEIRNTYVEERLNINDSCCLLYKKHSNEPLAIFKGHYYGHKYKNIFEKR